MMSLLPGLRHASFCVRPCSLPGGLVRKCKCLCVATEPARWGRVLRLATRDALALVILLGGHPVHCRTFSSIPGLPLPDASSSHPLRCDNQNISLNAPKYLLGRKTDLG